MVLLVRMWAIRRGDLLLDTSDPSQSADNSFDSRPLDWPVDERLVVEADREESVYLVDYREDIVIGGRPGILRLDPYPFPNLLSTDPDVRDPVDAHHAVRAPPRDTEQASRSMVLETPAEYPDARSVER